MTQDTAFERAHHEAFKKACTEFHEMEDQPMPVRLAAACKVYHNAKTQAFLSDADVQKEMASVIDYAFFERNDGKTAGVATEASQNIGNALQRMMEAKHD